MQIGISTRCSDIWACASCSDTESFVAFLKSLDGVRVDVTPTRVRVYRL